MLNWLLKELKLFRDQLKSSDKKVVSILVSVALFQTLSWYFFSRRFFRENLSSQFVLSSENYALIEYLYWFIGETIPLFILPLLIIKFLFKEKIRNYGVSAGNISLGIKYTILFSIVMIIIVWLSSANAEFAGRYPHIQSAKQSWTIFLIYELGMLIYMFNWEFTWRGYMLFGLEEKFGFYAIFIQMIPFVILHNGKPFLETIGAIFGGIALGFLAYRTRSVFYPVLVHFVTMFSIDLFSVLRYRTNELGISPKAFFNMLEKLF